MEPLRVLLVGVASLAAVSSELVRWSLVHFMVEIVQSL